MEKLYRKIVTVMEKHKSGYLDPDKCRIVLDLSEGFLFYYFLTRRLVHSISRREKITSSGQYGTINSEIKVYYDQNAEDKFRFTNKGELKELYNQILQ